jgi:hypothetical protein
MLGRNLNGSQIQYISALSPFNVEGAGSTPAFDLSAGTYLTVKVHTASDDLVVNIERSTASGGTFGQIAGLSLTGNASGLRVRSMPLESSAVWHKASYSMEPNGSALTSIEFEVQGQRATPINQDSNTVVWSDATSA